MSAVGAYVIPIVIAFIIIYAAVKKTNVYEAFGCGVLNGAKSLWNIFPSLFALFVAVSALRASGLIDDIARLCSPFLERLGFPAPLLPFALLRPISGSGSLALASDIFTVFGADSYEGRLASIMMGSTETTFYTVAVYFGASGTKDIRYSLKCALLADLFSVFASVVVCKMYY